MKLIVVAAIAMITTSPVHAHSPGQKVTATRIAVACKSFMTLKALAELMGDTPRFATFWHAQKASGECRTFPVGAAVIVGEDLRDGDKAIMRARPAEETGYYWTYPWYFK
jgi:hypothetical protein